MDLTAVKSLYVDLGDAITALETASGAVDARAADVQAKQAALAAAEASRAAAEAELASKDASAEGILRQVVDALSEVGVVLPPEAEPPQP